MPKTVDEVDNNLQGELSMTVSGVSNDHMQGDDIQDSRWNGLFANRLNYQRQLIELIVFVCKLLISKML